MINPLSIMIVAQLATCAITDENKVSIQQQGITYNLSAHLDIDNQTLSVVEQVQYVNKSLNPINTIYLKINDFMTIKYVRYHGDSLPAIKNNGILVIPLGQPLTSGDSCEFMISYKIDIPEYNGFFGYVPAHYEMTEWYPKVCIYDRGEWFLPDPGKEEKQRGAFALYDVTIDLPGDYIIAATGTQVDTAENMFMENYITTGRKVPSVPRRIAHFIAPRVNDFVWVCDPYFIVRRHVVKDITIFFFFRPYDIVTWDSAMVFSRDAITRFQDWFGMLPFANLAIVQGLSKNLMSCPQVLFVAQGMDPFTYLFESALVTDISRQWFGCAVDIDKNKEPWLSEGLATYASIRYLEDKYGDDQSMIKSRLFPALSLRYFHQANYYLMHTNHLEKPVTTPASDYDVSFNYTNSINSKPALFLFSLEKVAGREKFSQVIENFLTRHALADVRSRDFFMIYEEYTGQSMASLYDTFVNTTAFCDWKIGRVTKNTVLIKHCGGLRIPSEVFIETEKETLVYMLDAERQSQTFEIPEGSGEIVAVSIDPTESLMDPDYWNNYYPHKIRIRPIINFELPSFSTYNIYWLPYPWYDSYDGVTANFYWFGDRFADYDFIKGGHQFMGGVNYGFKSKRAYVSANYQTPVLFREGIRVRIGLNGSHRKCGDSAGAGLLSALGRPFTSLPQITIENRLIYNNVQSFAGLDSNDWSLGRNVSFENDFRYCYAGWDMKIGFALSHRALGSDWEYLKTTGAIQRTISILVPCKARFFIGKVIGDAPEHERLYLNGDLRINWFADLLFSQSGSLSPQEHIHIPGDGSMRGYQTLHIRSDQMYVLNLEFPSTSLFRVFTDIGYFDQFAFDAGVCLAISPGAISSLPLSGVGIAVNFPLYTYTDQPWALRWSIGFSM